MLKPWTRYLLYVPSLPIDLIGWLVVTFIGLVWGTGLPRWNDGALVATMRADSWPARSWYRDWGGTALGHAIFIVAGQESVLYHEQVHVRQFEGSCFFVFFAALAYGYWGWIWALTLWALGAWGLYVSAMLVALLRGTSAYRENTFEQAAYDHEKVKELSGKP